MQMMTTSDKAMSQAPAVIDAVRTPFCRSNSEYVDLMAHDLGRFAVNALISRNQSLADEIEMVAMGCVIADPNTPNVAREIVLGSTLKNKVWAYTTSMACISSNIAFTTACEMIESGRIKLAIAGGVETFSDIPIRPSRKLRQALLQLKKAKGFGGYWKLFKKLSLKDLSLDVPSPKEYSTNQSMGEGCERMAKRIGITREETDIFGLRSHQLAGAAWQKGFFKDHVVPVQVPPHFKLVEKDDGPRPQSTLDDLKKLKPSFDPYGLSTAATSSFFTDGASSLLVASQDFCQKNSIRPVALVRDYTFAAGDPFEELLLGPAFTIESLLKKNGLTIEDIDVWEIHEAFAAQVLANIKYLKDKGLGEIPMQKLNLWGGSLSLGHPFGATGGRIIMTAAKRLQQETGRYAIVAACAAGGQGSAILLEKPE